MTNFLYIFNLFFIGLIKIYRLCIAPLLGQNCRFYPSCSTYALTALQQYNVIKALYKIILRLFKCHPFHPGGFDPILPQADKPLVNKKTKN